MKFTLIEPYSAPSIVYADIDFDGICSVEGRAFWGVIAICYDPKNAVLEVTHFSKRLIDAIYESPCLIEDVAHIAYKLARETLGSDLLSVTCTGNSNVHGQITITVG